MLGGVPKGRVGMLILATKIYYYYENQIFSSNPYWNIHGCTMP